MRKLILLLLAAACPLAAIEYNVVVDVGSATSNVVTIQQPATGARTVRGKYVNVCSSVDSDLVIERDGTAATTTAATIVSANRDASSTTPKFKAWSSSDVGTGTTLYVQTIAAGGCVAVNMDSIFLVGNGTAKNWTARVTSSSSGRHVVNIKVDEY